MAENKNRLDVALVERGLIESRSKAGALIMAGQVYVNDQKTIKAGMLVQPKDRIEVRGEKNAVCQPRRLQARQSRKIFRVLAERLRMHGYRRFDRWIYRLHAAKRREKGVRG